MNSKLILLALLALTTTITAHAQGTAFTYQGRLNVGASPASGNYDLAFALFDAPAGGSPLAGPLTNPVVAVSNGLFTVALDFGAGVFAGPARWLEIGVRSNGSAAGFTLLSPRQELTPTPYAITSGNLSGALPAGQLSGTLPAATLPTGGNWPLTSTLTLDSTTLAIDPLNNRVGIGTSMPSTALTVLTPGVGYGLEHTDGARRLSTYLDENGCWLGSVSANPLSFFVNNGGSALTIDLSGKVGIGTTTPAQKLHLSGPEARLRMESTHSTGYAVTEYKTDGRTWHTGVGGSAVANGLNGKYYLYDDTASAVRLAVGMGGQVGIGTTDPLWPLHVTAAQSVARLDSSASDSGSVLELRNNTAAPLYLGAINFNNGAGTFPGQVAYTGENAMTFRTAGSERMRILSNGNVGVGTAFPTDALHVERPQATVRITSTNSTNVGSILVLSNSTPVVNPSEPNFASIMMAGKWGDVTLRYGATGVGPHSGTPGLHLEMYSDVLASCFYNYFSLNRSISISLPNTASLFLDRTDMDGELAVFRKDGVQKGGISVAGETVSYNAFTGSHYAWTEARLQRGQLVRMTGLNRGLGGNPANEVVYGVTPTTQANDPACLGSYLSLQEPAQPAGATNPHLVMAVGNGDMWVTDGGTGDLEPGNHLISSEVPGCAMKDAPARFPIGYICARAAEGVKWSEVTPDTNGVKRVRISVLFGSYERHSGSAAPAATVMAQQAEIESLQREVTSLRALKDRLAKLEALEARFAALERTGARTSGVPTELSLQTKLNTKD